MGFRVARGIIEIVDKPVPVEEPTPKLTEEKVDVEQSSVDVKNNIEVVIEEKELKNIENIEKETPKTKTKKTSKKKKNTK